MELKFSELYSRNEIKKPVSLTLDLKSINFENEDLLVKEPLTFTGELIAYENVVRVTGNIKGKLQLTCSRCLDSFTYDVSLEVHEEFTNDVNKSEDESVTLVEGDILDIAEVIIINVISTLPIKRLCKENCKGLCQECGENLNLHNCKCDYQDVDIRLAGLKDLFNK